MFSERLSRGKNTNVVLSEVDRLSEKRTQLEKLSDESLTEPAQDVLSEFTTNVELSITSEKVEEMVVSTSINLFCRQMPRKDDYYSVPRSRLCAPRQRISITDLN